MVCEVYDTLRVSGQKWTQLPQNYVSKIWKKKILKFSSLKAIWRFFKNFFFEKLYKILFFFKTWKNRFFFKLLKKIIFDFLGKIWSPIGGGEVLIFLWTKPPTLSIVYALRRKRLGMTPGESLLLLGPITSIH